MFSWLSLHFHWIFTHTQPSYANKVISELLTHVFLLCYHSLNIIYRVKGFFLAFCIIFKYAFWYLTILLFLNAVIISSNIFVLLSMRLQLYIFYKFYIDIQTLKLLFLKLFFSLCFCWFNFHWEFPGGADGIEPTCQYRRYKRCEFNPWVRKIPWRKAWQPTPVIVLEGSHGERSLASHSP